MNIDPEAYRKMADRLSPRSRSAVNVPAAFAVGGSICVLGELVRRLLVYSGIAETPASVWTSVILIGLSMLLTGTGWYGKLARHAGAGTLVPITGFANAVGSAAVEAQSEGYILGVGTKIFTIAGPVILYGSAASVIYGLVYYLLRQL